MFQTRRLIKFTCLVIPIILAAAFVIPTDSDAGTQQPHSSSDGALSLSFMVSEQAAAALTPDSLVAALPPSPGFEPLKATNAELLENGFPPRPTDSNSSAMAEWESVVESMKYYESPDPVMATPGSNTYDIYTCNWSGHVTTTSQVGSSPMEWSETTFSQPSVPSNSSYSNFQTAPGAAFWTGLGTSSIIQAGSVASSTSTAEYHMWTEDYPSNPVYEGPVVSPGDSIYIDVEYLGSDQTYFLLEDVTTNHYQSFDNSTPDLDQGSADYIAEAVGPGGMPNYSSSSITANYFDDSGTTYMLSTSNSKYIMTTTGTSSGTVISQPTSVSGGSFTQDWVSGASRTC